MLLPVLPWRCKNEKITPVSSIKFIHQVNPAEKFLLSSGLAEHAIHQQIL